MSTSISPPPPLPCGIIEQSCSTLAVVYFLCHSSNIRTLLQSRPHQGIDAPYDRLPSPHTKWITDHIVGW